MRAMLPRQMFGIFVLALAAAYAVWSIQFMWRHRDYFPIHDAVTAEIFLRYLWDGWNPLGFFEWYANEHRPAFPMAILALDHALAGTIGPFSTAAMFLSASALAVLLAAPDPAGRFDARRLLFAGAALTVLFWPAHWENFLWSSQIQIFLAFLTGVAALFLIVRAPAHQPPDTVRSAAIALLLFISCFSFAIGFVFAGAVLLVGFLRFGLSRLLAAIALTLTAGIVIYAVVFWGRDQFGYTAGNLVEPRRIVLFVLRFVGGPITVALERTLSFADIPMSSAVRLRLAAAVGFGAALYAVTLIVAAVRARLSGRQADISATHWMALGLSAFAFGNSFITALGRSFSPANYPVDLQRYYIGTLCFWLALLAHVTLGRPRSFRGTALATVAVALLFVASGFTYLDAIRAHAAADRKAGVAAMSRLSEAWPMFWLPDLLPDLYARYEKDQVLVFAEPWARTFGRALPETDLRRDDSACAGIVTVVAPLAGAEGGYQLTGSFSRPASADWLLISDASGTVRGFGAAQRVSTGEGGVPWVAFAQSAVLPLSVDVVLARDAVCRIGVSERAEGPAVPTQRQPYRTDFDAAATADPPDEALNCPVHTERVRWVDGRLLCMPMR
jgi:hypothetical protein